MRGKPQSAHLHKRCQWHSQQSDATELLWWSAARLDTSVSGGGTINTLATLYLPHWQMTVYYKSMPLVRHLTLLLCV